MTHYLIEKKNFTNVFLQSKQNMGELGQSKYYENFEILYKFFFFFNIKICDSPRVFTISIFVNA